MRIFVDIGSHEGQTIEEVVKPEYGFDRIYALEPMPEQYRALRRAFMGDPRLKMLNVGLGTLTGMSVMYGNNEQLEASLYITKDDVDPTVQTAVDIMDARAFFLSLPEGEVFVNMNCEGAELPILTRLLDTGAISRINYLLVDFDIRKIPEVAKAEEDLRAGLDAADVTWTSEYPVLEPEATHQEQIAAWLKAVL